MRAWILCLIMLTWAGQAAAQTRPWWDLSTDRFRVDARIDLPVTMGALTLRQLVSVLDLELDEGHDWAWFPGDESVRGNFSTRSARRSDWLAISGLGLPPAALAAEGINRRLMAHTLLYTEALSVSLAVNIIAKRTVRRRRPYTYNPDPAIQVYREGQGDDAYYSFFSGHASTAFVSAVAGSYLYSQATDDITARSVVWGVEMALASATSRLRVKAGKHYWSDVLTGALVGAATGFLVPYAHQREGQARALSGAEWASMGSGFALGLIAAELFGGAPGLDDAIELIWMPHSVPGGAGLAISGGF